MANEKIWAPWRLAYIQGDNSPKSLPEDRPMLAGADPACFLCQAVADSTDRDRHVVARSGSSIGVLNRYPYNNGHTLVAPRRHCARLDDLTAEELLDLSQMVSGMVGRLEKTLRAEGFNVGLNLGRVAGAGLPGHLHWHIVPRWLGDTNFMPVVAAVHVVPQSLDALWEALTGAEPDAGGG